jgi:ATP-binding cassette, subfamily G (WHITE), member 2, SNQ2
LLFSELNTTLAGTTSVTLFRRGSQVAIRQRTERTETHDEEKGYDVSSAHGNASSSLAHQHDAPAVIPEHIKMQDVFSWQHIAYTVPVSGGQRKLLDDVSGYVVPGKLTALMGESGAGKTTLLNVLAERTGTGIISGDRYVNGQALPSDFQAQT